MCNKYSTEYKLILLHLWSLSVVCSMCLPSEFFYAVVIGCRGSNRHPHTLLVCAHFMAIQVKSPFVVETGTSHTVE